MVCLILGYNSDTLVDATILGFILKISKSTKFNYVGYLSDTVH
jgi:hypothetical protein